MTWWLIQSTVVVAIGAMAITAVTRCLRPRPAICHAMWTLLLIKLLLPPLVAWPWRINVPAAAMVVPTAANGSITPHVSSNGTEATARPPQVDSVSTSRQQLQPASDSSRHVETAISPTSPAWSANDGRYVPLLSFLLVGGAIAYLLLQSLRVYRLKRDLRDSAAPPDWLREEVHAAATRLGIAAPGVRVVSRHGTPFLWGVGSMCLHWPSSLLAVENRSAWQGVIIHELAHLKRKDHWTGWLEFVAGVVWWWNPVFWYVRHNVREQSELACDAWVIASLPDGRRGYAEALIAVCQFGRNAGAPIPALGLGSGARRSFERRLTMILTEKIRSRLSLTGGLAIVAVGIMLIPAWSQVRRGSQPTTDSPFSIGSDERAPQPNFNNQPGQPVARDRATYGSNSLGGGDSFNADSAAVPGHNARPRHVVESQTFTLARTTYRLPKPAARQLATFLQQHLAGPHLVKADDNASTITVIASPEAQQTIGNLIQLLQGAEGQERPENPLAGFQPTLDGYYMDAAAEGEYTDDIAAPAENATTR